MNKSGGKYVAQVKDRENGELKLIHSSKYCNTKTTFRQSLKQYYVVKKISEV
jgi:hypothetical protein